VGGTRHYSTSKAPHRGGGKKQQAAAAGGRRREGSRTRRLPTDASPNGLLVFGLDELNACQGQRADGLTLVDLDAKDAVVSVDVFGCVGRGVGGGGAPEGSGQTTKKNIKHTTQNPK